MTPERCTPVSVGRVLRAACVFAGIVALGLWLLRTFPPPAADPGTHRVEVLGPYGQVEDVRVVAGRIVVAGDGYEYEQGGRRFFRSHPGCRLVVTRVPSPEASPW